MRTVSQSRAAWPPWWLLLLGAGLLILVHMFVWPTPLLRDVAGQGLPETNLFGAGDHVSPFLGANGADGRGTYVMAQMLDLVFIALAGAGLAVGIRSAATRVGSAWLVWLPLTAALVDTFEDVGLLAAVASFPTQALPPQILSQLTTLKFTLYACSLAALFWLAWKRRTLGIS